MSVMAATGDPTLRLKILRNRDDGFRKRSMALPAECPVGNEPRLKSRLPWRSRNREETFDSSASREHALDLARRAALLGKARAREIERHHYEARAEHEPARPDQIEVERTL